METVQGTLALQALAVRFYPVDPASLHKLQDQLSRAFRDFTVGPYGDPWLTLFRVPSVSLMTIGFIQRLHPGEAQLRRLEQGLHQLRQTWDERAWRPREPLRPTRLAVTRLGLVRVELSPTTFLSSFHAKLWREFGGVLKTAGVSNWEAYLREAHEFSYPGSRWHPAIRLGEMLANRSYDMRGYLGRLAPIEFGPALFSDRY